MKGEDEPITPDEFVLRLVWKDFYKDGSPPKINTKAFRPKPTETDGISVFREACLDLPERALEVIAEDKRKKYAIVRLPVAELIKAGITIEPAKIEKTPGHAVLPELNIDRYANDPDESMRLVQLLAILANDGVLHEPTHE